MSSPIIERDNSPAQFLWCFPLPVAGGCRAPKFLVAAGLGSQRASSYLKAAAWNFEQPRPPGVAEPARRPTGQMCLYCAKGHLFARTSILRASAVSPTGKPQAVGGALPPDNPPQHVIGRGFPRNHSPSPVKGRNTGGLQQDACSLALLPDRGLLGGGGIKTDEERK
jgi:hypothetical protein